MPSPGDLARGVYNAGRGFGDWLLPLARRPEGSRLEAIVNGIMERDPKIRGAVQRDPAIRQELDLAVGDAYAKNENLRRMAGYVDTADKALVPIDAVADYFKIMGGVGYGISAAKELVEAVFKLPYMAYYAIKTGDFLGALGNLLYEGLSWFIPGSLLDLTNRYADQADRYIERTAAQEFLQRLEGAVPAGQRAAQLQPSQPSQPSPSLDYRLRPA